jgi:hypothetical protein
MTSTEYCRAYDMLNIHNRQTAGRVRVHCLRRDWKAADAVSSGIALNELCLP